MSEVWYCPKEPVEHTTFECYVLMRATWLVDADNDYIKERNSEICEMDDYECHTCGFPAEWGIPPSALEQLAKAAE